MRSLPARSLLAFCLVIAPAAAQPDAATLKRKLPESDALTIHGDKLMLGIRDRAWQVVKLSPEGDPVISTTAGLLAVSADVLEYGHADELGSLNLLLASAKKGGVALDDVKFQVSVLAGGHLASDDVLVLPEGVARSVDAEEPAGGDAIDAAREAVSALLDTLDARGFNALSKKAIAKILDAACSYTAGEGDIVEPGFARRIIHAGWLEKTIGDTAEVRAVVNAVAAASRPAAVTRFTGDDIDIRELESQFDTVGWTLVTRARARYVRELPPPEYFQDAPTLTLLVELGVGEDPMADAPRAASAAVYHDGEVIASWSPEQGFRADVARWRNAIPDDPELVTDLLPPHVNLVSLTGRRLGIHTAHGSVAPPTGGSDAEVERFIAAAAVALPDAAHLDLYGELAFKYVNDSPDPSRPLLIGTADASGEIHQTIAQTLSTSLGGVCRGDCDDLAEVYHAILTRQGKLPHIMNVPGHNAVGWVEKDDDGRAHTYVLQTGPPLEFVADTVPESLKLAYTSFGAGDAFDANQCQIAVRFLGENLRSNWGLGHRIFTDAEYAKTMIDVQRDWHFSTYRRGVAKMEKLVQTDKDPANIHELAGLANATGQWDLAVRYMRQILEISDDPTFSLRLGILGNLLELERDDEALAFAKNLIENELPKAKAALGEDWYPIALSAASTLLYETDDRDVSVGLALEVAGQYLGHIQTLDRFLRGGRFDRNVWEQDEKILQIRLFLQGYATVISGFFHEEGMEEITKQPRLTGTVLPLEMWLARVAFHDIHEPAEVLVRYAVAGNWYRSTMGWPALRAALKEAPFPESREKDHTDRMTGLLQFHADLPWIKASVTFWGGAIGYLFREEAETLDVHEVVSLAREFNAAHDATNRIGLQSLVFDEARFAVDLLVAILTRDEAAIRGHFRHVKKLDDSALRAIALNQVGTVARFSEMNWYRRVLELWREEINYKPDWFALAWSVKLAKAPRHALLVADMAVEANPHDDAFREERDFMRQLLGDK